MSTFDEIKNRCDIATPGPWLDSENYLIGGYWVQTPEQKLKEYDLADFMKKEDAHFIAHARTDIPLLLRALELAGDIKIDDFEYRTKQMVKENEGGIKMISIEASQIPTPAQIERIAKVNYETRVIFEVNELVNSVREELTKGEYPISILLYSSDAKPYKKEVVNAVVDLLNKNGWDARRGDNGSGFPTLEIFKKRDNKK